MQMQHANLCLSDTVLKAAMANRHKSAILRRTLIFPPPVTIDMCKHVSFRRARRPKGFGVTLPMLPVQVARNTTQCNAMQERCAPRTPPSMRLNSAKLRTTCHRQAIFGTKNGSRAPSTSCTHYHVTLLSPPCGFCLLARGSPQRLATRAVG